MQMTLVAQQTKYYVSIGTNMVDDSFFTSYNPFEFEEQWHFGGLVSAFKFGFDVNNQWMLELGYASNTYEIGKRVNGQILTSAKDYMAYDLQAKHFWSNEQLKGSFFNKVHPFIAVGVGNVVLDQINRWNVNYGIGAMFWLINWSNCGCNYFNDESQLQRIGLLLQANGKSALNQKEFGNLLEYHTMIVYKF